MYFAELRKEFEKYPKIGSLPIAYETWFIQFVRKFNEFEAEIRQKYDWWKQHTEMDEECGYVVSDEMRSFLKFMKKILGEEKR